jgi:hypothetical protein
MAGKSVGPYLPCPGRILTCRRGGCMQAATDHIVQLCPVHLAAYELECGRRLVLPTGPSPARLHHPAPTIPKPVEPTHRPP